MTFLLTRLVVSGVRVGTGESFREKVPAGVTVVKSQVEGLLWRTGVVLFP